MNNFKIVKAIILGTFSFWTIGAFAQTLNGLNAYAQKVRIGLVDEFFDRFNGNETHPDIPALKADSRKSNLMMLFDLSLFSSKNDSIFMEASGMMDAVMADSININYSDTAWVAMAHCKGTLEGKSVKFDLFLTVQHRRENLYKWVIAKAEGNLFDTAPRNTDENIMLYPDDHETNFLSLKRMAKEQPFNVTNFMVNGFTYDATSVFVYLVYSGRLKIDYVDDLEFIFTQIPGYIFHLRYFERERNNAGWLISNFYKSTEENKAIFLKSLHSQTSYNMGTIDVDSLAKITAGKGNGTPLEIRYERNLKDIYAFRLNEKLAQVRDYICFMQQNDSLRAHSVYRTKMENLFVSEANVLLYDIKTASRSSKSIREFCNMLIDKSCECVSIDSICVPVWDDKISTMDATINKCELSACIRPFMAKMILDSIMEPNYNQILYVYKEDTEDGIEWLPLLGDIVITIK